MNEQEFKDRVEHAAQQAVKDELDSVMGDKRYINLERVPLICQSILRIDKSIEGIENNINWGVKIVIGAVLLALLGLVLTR